MISNERQYRITRAQADRLKEALASLESQRGKRDSLDPLIAAAELDGLHSQIKELESQLDDYDQLRVAGSLLIQPSTLDNVAENLIKQRIAKGLSQKQLSELLGVKEQQIQRYESTRYEGASLRRLQEISNLLASQPSPSARTLNAAPVFQALEASGLKKEFVLSRLIPEAVAKRIKGKRSVAVEDLRYVVDVVERVFGLNTSPLMEGAKPGALQVPRVPAKYKVPKGANETQVSILAAYAHYLATSLLPAITEPDDVEIPGSWEDARTSILNYGQLNLSSAAEFVWSLGIPILPLSRGGAFHGACLRIGDKTAVVLNRKSKLESLWLFDLLHELGHRVADISNGTSVIEEQNGTTASAKEELAAGEFAGNVVLGGRARELGTLVTNAAQGRVEYLKVALPQVAAEQGISVGALANFVAFELSRQGINWWGTAVALQQDDGEPVVTLKRILLDRVDLGRLNEYDRRLLINGLKEALT
jgi:transcriptional regulator with XRE-family HTH domain